VSEVARDPVNQPMIRHWCDAMSDHNPVYTDPDYAARSIHGGIVAPPAMLNAWLMPGLAGRSEVPSTNPIRELDAAGYTSIVATNCEHEYVRYLRLGERLHGETHFEEPSAEKQTLLGLGRFVGWRTSYTTDNGEEIGRMTFRVFKWKPGTGSFASSAGTGRLPAGSEPRVPAPAAPAATPATHEPSIAPPPKRPWRRETTLRAAEVESEQELTPCAVPITATQIVAGALASRDFQDVHHDKAAAIRRGTPDIFMNILTTCGLVARYVSDWAGPEALLEALRIRLGAPNFPGDVMTFSGRVAKAERGAVEVAVRGANGLGDHVTGTVALRLPA
jgi:acyl dehydratase